MHVEFEEDRGGENIVGRRGCWLLVASHIQDQDRKGRWRNSNSFYIPCCPALEWRTYTIRLPLCVTHRHSTNVAIRYKQSPSTLLHGWFEKKVGTGEKVGGSLPLEVEVSSYRIKDFNSINFYGSGFRHGSEFQHTKHTWISLPFPLAQF